MGAWGLILGTIGLIFTLVGFIATIAQVSRAEREADAARDAASAVQVRISRYDTAVDLAEARASLQNARHYASLDAWPQLVSCYEAAAEALGRAALQGSVIDLSTIEQLNKSRSRINKACYSIEKFLDGTGPTPVKSSINKQVRIDTSILQKAEQIKWKGVTS